MDKNWPLLNLNADEILILRKAVVILYEKGFELSLKKTGTDCISREVNTKLGVYEQLAKQVGAGRV
jgi:hypothetical protein